MNKRMLLVTVMAVILLMPLMAGEYQAESRSYEEAFAAGQLASNLQEAISKYALAAELAKTSVGKGNALNAQAWKVWQTGDYAGAKALCELAIGSDPEQYWAYNTLGACLMKEGDVDGAIVAFKKSIEVNEMASDADASARVAKAKYNLETALRLKNL